MAEESNPLSPTSETTAQNQFAPSTGLGNRTEGIVYVLLNPAMPGYAKIGKTDNLPKRMRDLFVTGVPVPFTCYYAARVNNSAQVERSLFEIFGDKRAHPNREFFNIEPHRAATAIKLVEIEDVTSSVQTDTSSHKEDTEAVNRATVQVEKKERFNFEMLDIPVGTELQSTKTPSIVCKVVAQKPPRVELKGEVMSLSAAAQRVMDSPWGLRGSQYWIYETETLQARRERLESGDTADGN